MKCLYCFSKLHVSNSRLQKRSNSVWRRRTCPICSAVFTSIEQIDIGSTHQYKSHTGDFEPFSRTKLLLSIFDACRHRNSAHKVAEALTDTIIASILKQSNDTVIERSELLDSVHLVLKRFDTVADTYFAAHHPRNTGTATS